MKRALWLSGGGLVLLAAALAAFFLWASGDVVPSPMERQVKTYDAEPAEPRDTLRVMTYNVGYLSGMTNNQPVDPPQSLFQDNMDRVAELIREVNPDFVGFQEIDFGADRSYDVHQLDTLATRLGYASAAQATNWDKRYVPFPYWPPSVHFGQMHSGQAVMGRFPIERHYSIELVRPPRPFWSDAFYLDRLAQVTVFNVDNLPFVVINVHLEAFHEPTRERQAQQVRALAAQYVQKRMPVLLIGDFNAVLPGYMTSMPAQDRARFQDDRTMEIIGEIPRLSPGISESRSVSGQIPGTYPADAPTRKIDHVLFSEGRLSDVNAEVRCIPSGDARPDEPPSDHCAVSMTFTFPRPTGMKDNERYAYFGLLPPERKVRAVVANAGRSAPSGENGAVPPKTPEQDSDQ